MKKESNVLAVKQFCFDEYVPDESIWSTDSYEILKIKKVIAYELTEIERKVFLLYCEVLSFRKLGVLLNVSTSTAHSEIKKIREKILLLL